MNRFKSLPRLALISLALPVIPLAQADETAYAPELFPKTKSVLEETFDGTLNSAFWEIRQSSTREI